VSATGPVRRVILQPTSFCNINCSYCYLPHRDARNIMPMPVVVGIGEVLARSGLLAERVEIRWHAGEPLTVPVSFYDSACEALTGELGQKTQLWFSLQTNGTLISERWCEFFGRRQIEVGVSIDGPPALHDTHRVSRRGAGTHARTMRGVAALRASGIAFDVISVITRQTLEQSAQYLDFMADLRPRSVGLNPEETEGTHVSALFADASFREEYTRFLAEMYAWQRVTGIPVRQLTSMRDLVLRGRGPLRNDQSEPLMMVSVTADGRMSTFSPELLGWSAPQFDDFTFGSVLDPSASLSRWSDGFTRLAKEVERGVRLCERSCEYFSLCGGGAPANKWAENHSFASTRTGACESNVMAVADVVLAALEADSHVS
jgi:uncharacterized protein